MLTCASLLASVSLAAAGDQADKPAPLPVPDKTVVLTFDDAVRSHLEYVAPLLEKHGFGATFFVSHYWMPDREHFLSWEEIAELHKMGFEIGNHTWTHDDFGNPKVAARLEAELDLVDYCLAEVGVPRPVSFAWPGNAFGPEAVTVLDRHGIRFARRGMQPEIPYGEIAPGPLYDPCRHHPLLIPTGGDAYPEWTLDAFKAAVDRAKDGKIAVIQFHGVPDIVHPWVHTPPERFREYMDYLEQGGFHVIAMRDLAQYIPANAKIDDPLLGTRFPVPPNRAVDLPIEVAATRADLDFWLENMIACHGYSWDEAAQVCGLTAQEVERRAGALKLVPGAAMSRKPGAPLAVLPYPGGRHPRIGFLDGAVAPQRGTKLSVFAPWQPAGYAVLDLPEAIWCQDGLLFLAHTHIPTIWDEANKVIENVDWERLEDGSIQYTRVLPNNVRFGARATARDDHVDLGFWLENGSDETLTGLRCQMCLMPARVPGFEALTNENKIFRDGVAAVRSSERDDRWLLLVVERCTNAWGNADVPCMHSDPLLPDLAPGERAETKGRVWFYEGDDIDGEIARAARAYPPLGQ